MNDMPSTAKGGHRLEIIAILAMVPLLAVCIFAAFLEAEQSRALTLNDALGRARTAMSAVDFELRGHVLTVEAMATSRSFRDGDLRAMYEECRNVMPSQPAWLNVGLQSENGAQIFNVVEPFGGPPVPQGDQESLERALELGTPQIGNVAVGPAIDSPATRVRVPVRSQGKLRYVVSVALKPQLFEDILGGQQLPAGWHMSLVDGRKRVVAAVPPRSPSLVPEPLPLAPHESAAPPSGRGSPLVRRDNVELHERFVRSAFSGWQVTVSVPKEVVESAAWKGARPIILALMAALVVTAFMIWLTSLRSESPT